MPFGQKRDASGRTIDFDRVYEDLIKPSIEDAGMEPIRADEEQTGGIIHKPMYERLVLCEFAVADLTTANANVFYELGLRHAVRPWSTVLMFAEGDRLPFDVGPLRAMPYKLNDEGLPSDIEGDLEALTKTLKKAREDAHGQEEGVVDSPLFQLVEGFPVPDLAHTKTDVFRDRVEYSKNVKKALAAARKEGVGAIRMIEEELSELRDEHGNVVGDLKDREAGAVIDLFLSYRSVKAWDEMIGLSEKMSKPLQTTVLVQEQLGLALNRAGKSEEAEEVLKALIEKRGPSSETLGILGRVYKDRWENAAREGNKILADALLDKAIDAYLNGFEADWRDAYPGINAVTLMELKEERDERFESVFPVVQYAVEQRIAKGEPDYWDYATLLELAVLGNDEEEAKKYAGHAIAAVREVWEPETTVRNLRLIREAREKRGQEVGFILEIEKSLGEAK